MRERNWLLLGTLGIAISVIGTVLAMQTVMVEQSYGGFTTKVPTMPYLIPGTVISVFGGLVGTIGIVVFFYRRSKRVAKGVIKEAILEAEEEKKQEEKGE